MSVRFRCYFSAKRFIQKYKITGGDNDADRAPIFSRLVGMQRDQIAVLKAFGYDKRAIGGHYLQMAFAAVFGGVVFGVLLGAWVG